MANVECEPTKHQFHALDTTPRYINGTEKSFVDPQYHLFCINCGLVKKAV